MNTNNKYIWKPENEFETFIQQQFYSENRWIYKFCMISLVCSIKLSSPWPRLQICWTCKICIFTRLRCKFLKIFFSLLHFFQIWIDKFILRHSCAIFNRLKEYQVNMVKIWDVPMPVRLHWLSARCQCYQRVFMYFAMLKCF